MASLLFYRNEVPSSTTPPPLAGTVIGVILFTSAISILSWFLTQRSLAVKTWWHLPSVAWLVFTLYVDSWTFVFATGIINYGIGIDMNEGVCSAAILSYLFCYMSTKVLIYIFLIEKEFIIRGGPKRRLESKLYLFNSFGVLTVHGIISILNFVYRSARLEDGRCIIGIGRQGLIPLITLDIVVIVYLTILFLNPLRGVNGFQNISNAPSSPRLRNVAMRTFIGALCTTTSTVINLIVLMVLDGEPGWVFLTCCNADILFSALVIQWTTRHDPWNTNANTSPSFSSHDKHTSYRPPAPPAPTPLPRRNTKKLAISLPLKTTSTSQYEHIFGDPDPPDAPSTSATSHKHESTSLDEPTDSTILTPIPKPIPVEINLGRKTPSNPPSPTPSRNPSRNPSRTTSRNRSQSRKPSKDKDKAPDRSWLSTLTRTHTHTQAQITDLDLVPAPLSPTKPISPPPPATPSSVSAAVAADLERIRRYRDRRAPTSPPPPAVPALTFASPSSPTSPPPPPLPRTPTSPGTTTRISRTVSRTRGPGSVSRYRISELAFEGDEEELPWHNLVVMEDGDGADSGGWI
ncbi:uncharacterized protein GGS22DRAFT_169587 [Annulohypoxylon maeteangense]|uniref:uncharacterized protein n=1 Tax=Annulohypoxylon maeteangense TaxID=1927788 RepID=UPI002008DD9F|nr:uncharacterized protein GGS22DRAFT_169587 [Annulohypoxylon maeteangense]KAI0882491.1 hypothetical protein GGS22DRAFT_169587 [Annulohypoxylon maeteangense]